MKTAKLYALYRLGADYHSGQWSQGYRIMCKAGERLRRLGILRPLDQISLTRPEFRREVAHELRRYRDAFKRNG